MQQQPACREQDHGRRLGNHVDYTVDRCDIARSRVLEHDVRRLIRITREADVQSEIRRQGRRRFHAACRDLVRRVEQIEQNRRGNSPGGFASFNRHSEGNP